jgi:predicted nucleotidyltransferase
MDHFEYPNDFSEFLRLFHSNRVEFLVVGGFAVAIHGYPRATADLDIWISRTADNARRVVEALREFGFLGAELNEQLFQFPNRVVRMGVAPNRIEILTDIDGVEFSQCFGRADHTLVDGVRIPVISLEDLRINKASSGRPRDIDDLNRLPSPDKKSD